MSELTKIIPKAEPVDDVNNDEAITAATTALEAITVALDKVKQVDVVTAAQQALDAASAAVHQAIAVAVAVDNRDLAVVLAEQADKINAIEIRSITK